MRWSRLCNGKFPNLNVLCVGGKSLTARPFSSLVNCHSLTTLCINASPNITDDIFLILGTVPRLATLYIGKCPEISREGLNSLKKSKPYLRIVFSARSVPVEQITELAPALNRNVEEGFLD